MKNNKNNNCNFPTLRFPEFSEEWKRIELSKVCNINPQTPQLSDEFIYIDLESVVKGELLKKDKISKANAPSRAQRVLEYGDILFQCVRPYQMNNFYFRLADNVQWVASTGYAQIRTRNYDGGFVYHYLNSKRFNCDVLLKCTGTSYPAISSTDLGKIDIFICHKEEQEKIARFLSLIDERIATQNKIIAHLESLIKGLNNYLHIRYGNDILISLADVGQIYGGLSGKSAEDFGRGEPYITYLNVYQNDIIDEWMVGLVTITANENQNTVQYGDVLFTLSSETADEVGIASIYLSNNNDKYLNSFCFGYRLKDFETLNPEYLPYCFSSDKFRRHILPFAQGSTRYNLQKADFIKSKFKVPTMLNQKAIANIMYTYNTKLISEKYLLTKYKEQKCYLLQKLFI